MSNTQLNIKSLREKNGFTQQQLAEKLGVSRGQIANYENGENSPSLEIIYKMLVVLDTTPNLLFGTETIKNSPKKGTTEDDLRKTIEALEKIITYDELKIAELKKQLKECQKKVESVQKK
jgi:transcriptional regulator with XRE-family HTH domain